MKCLLIILCVFATASAQSQSKKKQIEELKRIIGAYEKAVVKYKGLLEDQRTELLDWGKEVDSLQLEADLLKNRLKQQNKELIRLKQLNRKFINENDSLSRQIEKLEDPYGKKKQPVPMFTFGSNGGSGSDDDGNGDLGRVGGVSDGIRVSSRPKLGHFIVDEHHYLTYYVKIDAQGKVIKATPIPNETNTVDAGLVLKIRRILVKELTYSNPKGLHGMVKKYRVHLNKK